MINPYIKELLRGVPVGRRNCAAAELARWFYQRRGPRPVACYHFLEKWNGKNQDPLPLYELASVADSMLKVYMLAVLFKQ